VLTKLRPNQIIENLSDVSVLGVVGPSIGGVKMRVNTVPHEFRQQSVGISRRTFVGLRSLTSIRADRIWSIFHPRGLPRRGQPGEGGSTGCGSDGSTPLPVMGSHAELSGARLPISPRFASPTASRRTSGCSPDPAHPHRLAGGGGAGVKELGDVGGLNMSGRSRTCDSNRRMRASRLAMCLSHA
jgi:hypothetical protein